MSKVFRLTAEQIRPVATGYGACFASDHITVEGRTVGVMYREVPEDDADSGWRFLSGFESQEFLDDPENLELYDVNTIANYDAAIIPYLDAPPGATLVRAKDGSFVEEDSDS